jgi:predicted glycogen debranching enzyme
MESIIASYRIGTKYNIHEDHDGLIISGIEGVEVSWMNERVDNWCPTPRIGKCVEVNALWYNVLMAMGEMSHLIGRDPYEFQAVASWIKEAFEQTFWDPDLGYLYDVVTDEEAYTLSKTIAKEIEFQIEKFPGDIIVNVIREKRIRSVAKSI